MRYTMINTSSPSEVDKLRFLTITNEQFEFIASNDVQLTKINEICQTLFRCNVSELLLDSRRGEEIEKIFSAIINNPEDNLRNFISIDGIDKLVYEYFNNKFPGISECRCNKIGRSFRKEIENSTVTALEKKQNTNDVLEIVSLASGHCLQELTLIEKLIKKGYTKINISLIDNDSNLEGSIASLRTFLNDFFSSSPDITIKCYSSLTSYQMRDQKKNTNLVLCLYADDVIPDPQLKIKNSQGKSMNIIEYSHLNNKEFQLFTPETIMVFTRFTHTSNNISRYTGLIHKLDHTSESMEQITEKAQKIFSTGKL